MNKDTKRRATLAKRTVKAHAIRLYGKDFSEPTATVVTDLLTDLLHFCDSEGLDFSALNKVAHSHYAQEVK